MSRSVDNFINGVSEDTIESFLTAIADAGVPLQDSRIETFLEKCDLVEQLHARHKDEIGTIIREALGNKSLGGEEIASVVTRAIKTHTLATDYLQVADIVDRALINHSSAAKGASFGNLDPRVVLGGILTFGVILGAALSGFSAFGYFLPRAVEASRLQDVQDIKYLGTKEGKVFREIVRLNSGHLDTNRCRDEAKKQGYSMVRGKEKVTDICLVVVPKL